MESDRVLAAFDAEVRRNARPDGSGARIETGPLVVRWVGADGRGWSGIAWSRLDDADADAVIAEQVAYFAARDEAFEWKLYDYDRPPDLDRRLVAAGFAAEGEESLMVTEVSSVPAQVDLPPGLRLLPVTDEAGVGLLADVHEQVFGTDSSRLRRSLLAQLRDRPEAVAMVVAMAGDQPVCSARIEFLPGSSFASLWGGATLASWRGQGIYRVLIAYRARLAAARGYRYLYVDASPDSQPILARFGFSRLARTTPYIWDPRAQVAGTAIKPGVPAVSAEVGSADPVATPSFPPVVLRNSVVVEDPLSAVLGLLTGPWHFDVSDPSRSASFGEADLRLANRGGARISAAEIEAVLERRHAIEPALQAIALDASLAGGASSVPWLPLRQLFDAFAGIRGIGFAKMTKTLHPKRPALIPLLDSVVRKYLEDDDLGAKALFGERALELVRGYERDLDRNGPAVRAVRQELARRDFRLTEVRILDLLIFSAVASPRGSGSHDGTAADAPQITPIREL